MKAVLFYARETLLLLFRDKVFHVFLTCFLLSLFFVQTLNSLYVRDFTKPFFDMVLFFYHSIGGLCLVFWSSKVLTEGLSGRAYLSRVCLTYRRWELYLGSNLGVFFLCFLFFFSSCLLSFLFFSVNGFVGYSLLVSLLFSKLFLFTILAAMTICLSTFLSSSISFVAGFSFWVIGLGSRGAFEVLDREGVGGISYYLFASISSVWDLTVFNLHYFDYKTDLSGSLFFSLALQALLLIAFFFCLGLYLFERKDLA